MKTKPKLYRLFFCLAFVLFSLAYLTRNYEYVASGWDTTIGHGFISFFIPSALYALAAGFMYASLFKKGRMIKDQFIIVHFVATVLAVIFYMVGFYYSSNFIFNLPAWLQVVLFLAGPFLFLVSVLAFVMGILQSKKN